MKGGMSIFMRDIYCNRWGSQVVLLAAAMPGSGYFNTAGKW
jgi:hypothetical protein